jgi:hypothetical protein
MSTGLIRWEPDKETDGGGALAGFTGTRPEPAFKLYAPDPVFPSWQLTSRLFRSQSLYGDSEGELKQRAEEMLREFASSLVALFATDLRKHLTEQAAIHQEHGGQAHAERDQFGACRYWGKAEALRDVLKYLDHQQGENDGS